MDDIQKTMRQLQPGDKLVMTFQKSQKPFWSATGGGEAAGPSQATAEMAPPPEAMVPPEMGGLPPEMGGMPAPDEREMLMQEMAARSAGQ
jgi:hypothetical protein